MKNSLTVIVALLASFNLAAKVAFIEVKTLASYEKMLELARTTQKDIFIYVDDIQCEACKTLDKGTFKNKALTAYLSDNYISLKVNAATELGELLIELYSIQNVPTLLVLNAYEIMFGKHQGLIDADELMKKLKAENMLARNYQNWARGAAAGTLPKLDYMQFLLIEHANKRVTASHKIVRDVSTLLDSSDFEQPVVLRFVEELCLDIDGPVFQTLIQKPQWITDTVNFSWTNYQANVYNYNIGIAITKKDSVYLEESLLRIQQMPHFYSGFNFKLRGRQLYLAELKKWLAYDTLTFAYLEKLPEDSADAYQREAIYLMEYYPTTRPQMLALKYLRRGIERKETFRLYYTLALLLYQQSDNYNAFKAAYIAEELATNPQDKKLAKRLQTRISSEE